jgi:CheY-like chemotaxis protein
VQDTGIGIDEADKDKLFRSFTQIDGSKKKKFRGTGLGLSISRKLVDLMGGEIEAQSRIGEGSTFIFKVPPGPEPLVEAGESEPPASSKAEDYPMRVLLAEDNELNRTFVTHFLQLAGHEVTGVTDGGKAVQALDESAYDVVLMDVQMPIMDGLEATRAIRESNREYKDIPIIALTAYAMPGDRQRFLDAGMDDYVSKPVDMEALLEAMARTCN